MNVAESRAQVDDGVLDAFPSMFGNSGATNASHLSPSPTDEVCNANAMEFHPLQISVDGTYSVEPGYIQVFFSPLTSGLRVQRLPGTSTFLSMVGFFERSLGRSVATIRHRGRPLPIDDREISFYEITDGSTIVETGSLFGGSDEDDATPHSPGDAMGLGLSESTQFDGFEDLAGSGSPSAHELDDAVLDQSGHSDIPSDDEGEEEGEIPLSQESGDFDTTSWSPKKKKVKLPSRSSGGGGAGVRGKGGRPLGSQGRTYNDAPVKTFPATDSGLKKALQAAKIQGGFDFKRAHGSNANDGDAAVFTCISHSDCPAAVKVVTSWPDGYEVYVSKEPHSNSPRVKLPSRFQGISAEFITEVDKLIMKGISPYRIEIELRTNAKDESTKSRVPTADKIRNRKRTLEETDEFNFTTMADLALYAKPLLIQTRDELDKVNDYDRIIIVELFECTIHVMDPSTNVKVPKASLGFIYLTKRILEQFKSYVLMMINNGEERFVLSLDGTYRFMDKNWTLIDGGSLTTRFAGGQVYGKEYVQSMITFLFCFCEVESTEIYEKYIIVFSNILNRFYNMPVLNITHQIQDRAAAIATAQLKINPGCLILNDYYHIRRKLREGKFNAHHSESCTQVLNRKETATVIYLGPFVHLL